MSKKNLSSDGFQASVTKSGRNVARTLQRGHSASGYFRMRGHERLSGGADAKSKSTVQLSKSVQEANESGLTVEVTDSSKVASETEKDVEPILGESNELDTTGDKKVDEMIDYVIQNLREAGKVLATLGENFEHDLKLMFVDVMGKVQNWVSVAQIRIDAARNDLRNLRNELASRSKEIASKNREIDEIKKKLADTEIAKIAYEKVLTENSLKSIGPQPTPSAMSFVPSRQPMPTGVSRSEHLADENSSVVHPPGTNVTSAQSSRLTALGTEGPSSVATLQYQQQHQQQQQQQLQQQQQQQQQQELSRSERQLLPATIDVAVQSGKGKERRRESELESELARLRKENERIVRERTDYENAIQRALLRGVSSLNAETLKVLRCPPPVSCYTPCGPPPSPANTIETMTPCPSMRTRDDGNDGRRTDDATPAGRRTAPSSTSRRGGSKIRVDESFVHDDRVCCAAKRPTTGAHGSSSRYRKSSGGSTRSTATILQQAASPTGLQGACVAPCNVSPSRTHGRVGKSKKLEASICTRKLG